MLQHLFKQARAARHRVVKHRVDSVSVQMRQTKNLQVLDLHLKDFGGREPERFHNAVGNAKVRQVLETQRVRHYVSIESDILWLLVVALAVMLTEVLELSVRSQWRTAATGHQAHGKPKPWFLSTHEQVRADVD
jgi:hypothetical protein